ncbi:polysaccharide deacetylase [Natrarchaeobius halalkaliphilus]|uniref:Polysaccharide deacetylase n=1 Tax=Natrarchaeobius halalkaliphilus TaxID=1679091 RepID=A0A3N6M5F3_9EURY|nr:polysaccharide deacetylase family protein [Natrarchaeobius halalkaliphilus]RQG91250.1 polysaccharide deacetylase [Natrarchaeobius halalkaliphilus]
MGSVVLSLDAELGWGFHDFESPPVDRVEAGRRGWSVMLELLEEYDVPATWAVVGHLMLDSCDGTHADHPAPPGWFAPERTEWRNRPDLRFAPALVEALFDSDVDHEFASHSFSHVLFGDPETDRELAAAELDRSMDIAADWGRTIESFVYPRNDVGHRDVLAEYGFGVYRGKSPTHDGVRGLFDSIVRSRSMLVEPAVDEYGLVNVPASLFLFGFEGPARTAAESVWADPMVVQARLGIDEAARRDGVFHMWLHPNNLTDPRDDERMRAILEHLDRRREETDIRVETMGETARRLENGRTVDGRVPSVEYDATELSSTPSD